MPKELYDIEHCISSRLIMIKLDSHVFDCHNELYLTIHRVTLSQNIKVYGVSIYTEINEVMCAARRLGSI